MLPVVRVRTRNIVFLGPRIVQRLRFREHPVLRGILVQSEFLFSSFTRLERMRELAEAGCEL